MRVIIAPDKFKGSLSALEAAHAIRDGLSSVLEDVEIVCCPIADGGEGTAEILCRAFEGSWQEARVRDPLDREVGARYCWSDRERDRPVALLEMSEASGMRRLQKKELDPLRANTFGTGELILAGAAKGARTIIVGLGGSATNDGGMGLAAALGFRFLDKDDRELTPLPCNLRKIARIERPRNLDLPEVVGAADVRNPLLGDEGATRVYGAQKGAGERELEELENGLKHLAEIVERDLGCRHRETAGAGAAGGLGFGLLSFCGGRIRNGFDLVAEALELEQAIRGATFVVTAEGKMDAQTLHGKGPAGVAALARKCGKPLIAFAGSLSDEEKLSKVFDAVVPIAPGPIELDEAVRNAAVLLSRAAARVGRLVRMGGRFAP